LQPRRHIIENDKRCQLFFLKNFCGLELFGLAGWSSSGWRAGGLELFGLAGWRAGGLELFGLAGWSSSGWSSSGWRAGALRAGGLELKKKAPARKI
jgi:hypothetical protein